MMYWRNRADLQILSPVRQSIFRIHSQLQLEYRGPKSLYLTRWTAIHAAVEKIVKILTMGLSLMRIFKITSAWRHTR